MEKAAEVCPPDFIKDVFPIFVQQLETRPPQNAKQYLLAVEEFYALIALFNREYVSEPFRRMRLKRWPMAEPSILHEVSGTTNPSNSKGCTT